MESLPPSNSAAVAYLTNTWFKSAVAGVYLLYFFQKYFQLLFSLVLSRPWPRDRAVAIVIKQICLRVAPYCFIGENNRLKSWSIIALQLRISIRSVELSLRSRNNNSPFSRSPSNFLILKWIREIFKSRYHIQLEPNIIDT